tara:strand:+ start:6066 stop:6194 length:129 start_codon:yes stop_codon:yes gene_type:complete
MNLTAFGFLERDYPELKKELEKHLLRNKVTKVMQEYLENQLK